MNAPNKQSNKETPVTPQAILMPDHGTIPISLSTDRRTQPGDLSRDEAIIVSLPSSAFRVSAKAFGKNWEMIGAKGVANNDDSTDPTAVREVMSNVADTGDIRTPDNTF